MKGEKGDTGASGRKGETGAIGPRGLNGVMGAMGPQGPQGIPRPAGAIGSQGPKGPQGDQGPKGPAGETGAMGPVGPEGPQGPQGAQGPMGPQGKAGLNVITSTLVIPSFDANILDIGSFNDDVLGQVTWRMLNKSTHGENQGMRYHPHIEVLYTFSDLNQNVLAAYAQALNDNIETCHNFGITFRTIPNSSSLTVLITRSDSEKEWDENFKFLLTILLDQ
jgi:hypothetical protein